MTEPRIINMPASVYYADPCDSPSLTQSTAHTLLTKSPLHAWMAHPKLGGKSRKATAAMSEGALLHALLLGEEGSIVCIDADNFRTKEAQKERDAALAAGMTPILIREYEEALSVAQQIRDELEARDLALDGLSEQTVLWTEHADDGTPVQCRGRIDHLRPQRGQIIDLKKSRSAHPKACSRHVEDYGYAIQCAAYRRALVAAFPELAGREDFVFVFIEPDDPLQVVPARLSGEFLELGVAQWRRAVNLWAKCLRENHWPGYVGRDEIVRLEPSPWAMARELENEQNI